MGRNKDPCWEYVTILEELEIAQGHSPETNKKLQCNHCGHIFSGGASRIKGHIFGLKNQGVKPCPKIIRNKENVNPRPSHLEENLINLDSPSDGKTEDICRSIEGQITTYEEINVNSKFSRHGKKQVGPFAVLTTVDDFDSQLIKYVFDSSLAESKHFKDEKIISFPYLYLNRGDFRTLKPRTSLNSAVIDVFAEYLTLTERRKSTPSKWYLPVMFSTWALDNKASSFLEIVEKQSIRKIYMPELVDYEKMFIPVYINLSQGHYYLYVIHLKRKEVEIWDSCPSKEDDYRLRTQKLLLALDYLFVEDPRCTGLAFRNFTVIMAKNNPLQSNNYDCGIFVIKFMQQSVNQFGSEDERLGLALELLKSDLNIEKEILHLKVARRKYVQREEDLPTPEFNKTKGIDACMYSEEAQKEEHATSVYSTTKLKKKVRFHESCLKSPNDIEKEYVEAERQREEQWGREVGVREQQKGPELKPHRLCQLSFSCSLVRKEKMGDRIKALQELVSPFGKADTASVLLEAIGYIRFLHAQVDVLSAPYMKSGASIQFQQALQIFQQVPEALKQDLKSRGLCLVPISSTFPGTH